LAPISPLSVPPNIDIAGDGVLILHESASSPPTLMYCPEVIWVAALSQSCLSSGYKCCFPVFLVICCAFSAWWFWISVAMSSSNKSRGFYSSSSIPDTLAFASFLKSSISLSKQRCKVQKLATIPHCSQNIFPLLFHRPIFRNMGTMITSLFYQSQ
jgi:hypothetical protein